MVSEALAVQERDPRAAEAMFREIIAIQQTWDPPDPHRVAKSLGRLGTLLGREGRTTEAAAALSQAIELLVQNCPDDLFWQVPALWGLGEALIAEERLDEAESALLRVEQITSRHVGSDHPWRVRALRSLGRLHAVRSDFTSAELQCRQSLDMARRLFPDSHLETAESLDALGMLYADSMGRIDEAIPLLEESLKMRESLLADEYFEKARGILSLGRVLAKAGRSDDAERQLLRCYALCDAHGSWPSYIGRSAAAELAAVYRARGDVDAATKWLAIASARSPDPASE
jgi:tetratricopeptide (TPR) repeat protein